MDQEAARLCLAHVLETFPQDIDLIERLAREDDDFMSICEDYALTCETLSRHAALSAAQSGFDVEEYRALEAELRDEIERELRRCRGIARP